MRRGEILNLKWPQVDFKNKRVYVIKTKSNRNRYILMTKTLYYTLQSLKAEANGSEKVYPFKFVQGVFEKARKDADLQGLRLHDLRHTFASRVIQKTPDPYILRKILGHSTITMTMRYVHPSEDQMREAMAKLDRDFAQSLHNSETHQSRFRGLSRATRAESVS